MMNPSSPTPQGASPKPAVLGLTGSYGSGKSTVAAFFREAGAAIIDADRLAREVVEPGQEALGEIAEALGAEAIDAQGRLDRAAVARMVFEDPARRRVLEQIIHPRVRQRERQMIAQARARGDDLVVADVPLLFESGFDRECDRTCVVVVSEAVRRERLARLGVAPEEIQRRLKAQMSQEEKAARADFVIDNSGTMEQTRRQALRIAGSLISTAGLESLPKE